MVIEENAEGVENQLCNDEQFDAVEAADVSRQFIEAFLTRRPMAELPVDLRPRTTESLSVECGQLLLGDQPCRMMPAVSQPRAPSPGRCQQLITPVRGSGMQVITVASAARYPVNKVALWGGLRRGGESATGGFPPPSFNFSTAPSHSGTYVDTNARRGEGG